MESGRSLVLFIVGRGVWILRAQVADKRMDSRLTSIDGRGEGRGRGVGEREDGRGKEIGRGRVREENGNGEEGEGRGGRIGRKEGRR